MSMEDQNQDEIRFLRETHELSFSNSNNSKESNEKLEIKPCKNEEGGCIGKSVEKEVKSSESGHEIHKRIKRERRQNTRNLFSNLHALLPHLPSKVNQITIVSEAISYIKSLEHTVQKLEKQKQERLHSIDDHGSSNNLPSAMVKGNPSNSTLSSIPHEPVNFQTLSCPSVVLNICGDEAKFFVCTSKKLDLMTNIALVLEKYKIEVKCANIWSKDGKHGVMILAAQNNMVPLDQFPKTTSVEDVYKQAAEEINALIS